MLCSRPPQAGHLKPSGHRDATTTVRHCSSLPYCRSNAGSLSPFWNCTALRAISIPPPKALVCSWFVPYPGRLSKVRNQEAFCDSKAARLGRLPAGESKPWRCGRGWGVSGGVRDGPEEQSLQGLEPDGVGILPSAARAARRDTEGNGRHAPPRHSDRVRPRGADDRDDGPGAAGGTTLPP